MTDAVSIRCPGCSAVYALPPAVRDHIEGKGIRCPGCGRWFVGVRASSGPPIKLVDGKPARSPIDLGRYHTGSAPAPQQQPAARQPMPQQQSTPQQPVAPQQPMAQQPVAQRQPAPQQPMAAPQPPPPQTPQAFPPHAAPPASPFGGGAGDVRTQVVELAGDVHGDTQSFDGAPSGAVDLDQTVADIGASGFASRRFANPLAGLDLKLVRTDGPTAGQEYHITKASTLIGRRAGDLLIQDQRVSSKHAQLDVMGPGSYSLKDLASTNGTLINGRPISLAQLSHGDTISFGGVEFKLLARSAG